MKHTITISDQTSNQIFDYMMKTSLKTRKLPNFSKTIEELTQKGLEQTCQQK